MEVLPRWVARERRSCWASTLHGERWTLRWLTETEGYERVDQPERDVRAETEEHWAEDPAAWRTTSEVAAPRKDGGIGRGRKDVQAALDTLVAEGRFETEKGPEGRSARAVCYRPLQLVRGVEQVEQVDPPPPCDELVRPDLSLRRGRDKSGGEVPLELAQPSKQDEDAAA